MKKVLTIFGTRPEAIKMAPVISQLRRSEELESVAPTEGRSGGSRDSGARSFSLQARTGRGGHGQSKFL